MKRTTSEWTACRPRGKHRTKILGFELTLCSSSLYSVHQKRLTSLCETGQVEPIRLNYTAMRNCKQQRWPPASHSSIQETDIGAVFLTQNIIKCTGKTFDRRRVHAFAFASQEIRGGAELANLFASIMS